MKPLDVSSMLKPKKIQNSNLAHFGQKIEQTSHCALRNGRSGYHLCFTSDNLTDHFLKVSGYAPPFWGAKSLCLYVPDKLQRRPSIKRSLKIFIFPPYEFEKLGFLTNVCRGVMRSKTQWVFTGA
jgi:hypothetical protein